MVTVEFRDVSGYWLFRNVGLYRKVLGWKNKIDLEFEACV